MTLGFAALCAVVVSLVTVLWRAWVARDAEKQRAIRAEAEAERWRKVGHGSDGVAHDVANLLSAAFFDLHTLGRNIERDPERAHSAITRVRSALRAVTELLNALRVDLDDVAENKAFQVTTEGHVRLQIALYRNQVPIDTSIRGTLDHGGHSISAARVIQNLFHNAVREAKEAGGDIHVALNEKEFCIRNRVRPGSVLDDSIYTRGKSDARSSGVGLAVCVEQARIAGWRLQHSVEGDEVTFKCSLLDASERMFSPKSDPAALKN